MYPSTPTNATDQRPVEIASATAAPIRGRLPGAWRSGAAWSRPYGGVDAEGPAGAERGVGWVTVGCNGAGALRVVLQPAGRGLISRNDSKRRTRKSRSRCTVYDTVARSGPAEVPADNDCSRQSAVSALYVATPAVLSP